MTLEQIFNVIYLAVLVIGLLGIGLFAVLYFAKQEKEHKELVNEELKTRIALMNIYIKRHTNE